MSEVTVTGDATATITSGTLPVKRRGKSLNSRNQARWEARDQAYQKLWHDYYTGSDRQRARFNMAEALWDELHKAALKAFALKSAEGWNESASDQMRFAAEDFAQDMVIETTRKLDKGYFERENDPSSYNAFRAYVAKMTHVCHGRAQDELIKLNRYEPVLTAGPEDNDEEPADGEEALFHKGVKSDGNCLSITPEHIQLSLLHQQNKAPAELLAAYNESGFDAGETAKRLGINRLAATKRLSRLKQSLKLSELEAVMRQLFGEKDYTKAAADILPLIPALTQRATNEFPTMWQEALTLKPRPKCRRVAEDKPKSNWHQAVRWLYRLWARGRASEIVPVTHTMQIADTSPASCLKAFEDIICRFQEYTANQGGLKAIKYGRGAEAGKASHTGSSQTIVPSASDFCCDVSIAARRCLSSGEYAYFKHHYKSLNVVVEPEDKSCLQKHVDSFPESKRAAVKSLDAKIRLKLGARLIEVGIYPFADYIKPKDCRRAVLPTIQACSAESKPKGKLLPWPTEDETFDIQACADSAKFLTPDEAAVYLGGLNSRTMTRWAREGYIPAIPIGEGKRRLWRFLQADLEQWMLARRQGGQNAA